MDGMDSMDGPETTAGVRIGEVLAGKYRVDGVLGAGGMGVVVAAHHLQLDERVALKFLLPSALGDAEAVGRFAREARAAVKIRSEHVARVIDVGTLETGAPYIVMEFLEGSDLSAWLRTQGPLPIEQAVDFVLQACEAIAEAHSLGIIHRDLKPANLFVVRRNDGLYSVKVLDFGISKMTRLGVSAMTTKTNALMGSPFYMSPEQILSSKDVDPKSDIWTLGVILYELLSGKAPFFGDTFPEVCVKIATQPAPLLRTVRPDVPPGLGAAIDKCLQKDRAQRFEDVAQLAMALEDFASQGAKTSVDRICGILQRGGLSNAGRDFGVETASHPLSSPTVTAFGGTAREARRRRKSIALVAGLVAALAVVVGWVSVHERDAPRPDQPSAVLVSAAPAEPAVAPPPVSAVAPQEALLQPAPDRVNSIALPSRPEPASDTLRSHSAHLPGGFTTTTPDAKHAARPAALAAGPPAGVASTAAAASVRAAPTVNCDPPFYFDESGTRIFKRECVQ
jgi:serine/threonine-protein kinase